jgi:hypothetical protein
MMDQDDLIDLIAASRGEDLAPGRLEQLLARLREDEAFQQAYVDEIRMLGMLKAVQSMEPRWLRLQDELGWGPAEQKREGDFETELMGRVRDARPRRGLGSWRRPALAALAIGLAIGLAALAWPGMRRGAGPIALPAPSPAYPRVDVEHGLAMVIKLDKVEWARADEPHPAEGDILASGRLQIRSGRATLSMLEGVVLIVEGPADLDLISDARVFCRQGKLRARVPKGAEGLVISSPSAAVLDLGTEFGLNVQDGGKSQVKVFEGKVEAVVKTGPGSENLTRLMDARQVAEIVPGSGEIEAADGSVGFIGPLDLAPPSLALDPDYPKTVLASKPWGYWRFESMNGVAIPNEVPGRPSLLATGPIGLTDASADNHGVVFKAGESLQYLAMDGLWEPSAGRGYAVELWFLSESIDHSSLVSMPSPKDTNHHLLFLEIESRNRYALHPPASVRFLDRWPPSLGGGHNIYSENRYIPYRWHHLVGQMNGGRMELYLDGEPTRSTRVDLDHPTAPCQVLLGRLSTVPLSQKDDSRWFYGRGFAGLLDEVALYDHALSIEEIRRHHRSAAQRARDDRWAEAERNSR